MSYRINFYETADEDLVKWNRRINDEHRIVYDVDEINSEVNVISLYGHYEKQRYDKLEEALNIAILQYEFA